DQTRVLFGGADEDPVTLSKRVDRFRDGIRNAPWAAVDAFGRTMAGNLRVVDYEKVSDTQQMMRVEKVEGAAEQMGALLANDQISKALSGDQISGIQQALGQAGDVQKDISLTTPIPTGMVLFDLKTPSEELVPIE